MERMGWKLNRVKSGLTLSAIAKEVGCSPSLLSHYERGVRNIADEYRDGYEKMIRNELNQEK